MTEHWDWISYTIGVITGVGLCGLFLFVVGE